MWVIYPPGFDASRKYPVYMLLHGGPHNAQTDGTQWRWNAQVFAGWGYITTWHNFHGSSGFGQAFTDSINPDRISLPYEDTIKAAEFLMSKPYVDANRDGRRRRQLWRIPRLDAARTSRTRSRR